MTIIVTEKNRNFNIGKLPSELSVLLFAIQVHNKHKFIEPEEIIKR